MIQLHYLYGDLLLCVQPKAIWSMTNICSKQDLKSFRLSYAETEVPIARIFKNEKLLSDWNTNYKNFYYLQSLLQIHTFYTTLQIHQRGAKNQVRVRTQVNFKVWRIWGTLKQTVAPPITCVMQKHGDAHSKVKKQTLCTSLNP